MKHPSANATSLPPINDSPALTEIATTNDDYSACTEPSADKLRCVVGLEPPYRQYEIDRPPATCATCDEFTGDDDQLTWRWGNQGAATITYQTDAAFLAPSYATGTALHVRWTTGPDGSATDWVATAKYSNVFEGLRQGNGLILLAAGDETTPTKMYACSHEYQGGGALLGFRNITVSIWNSYTVFGSNPTQQVRISRHWMFESPTARVSICAQAPFPPRR